MGTRILEDGTIFRKKGGGKTPLRRKEERKVAENHTRLRGKARTPARNGAKGSRKLLTALYGGEVIGTKERTH